MRAFKHLAALIAVIVVMASSQTAFAQMNTYEMGPFYADGMDAEMAFGEMYDMIDGIVAALPEGHVLLEFEIESSGFLGLYQYQIVFNLTIWIPSPPGPPNSGGGGGGIGG
ncbi:MAG: hypothetical protein AB8B55_22410 [Mariniblastus sp.]